MHPIATQVSQIARLKQLYISDIRFGGGKYVVG